MNLTQQRFLLNRLDEAKRGKPSRYGSHKVPDPSEPLKVKQARRQVEQAKKVINDWEVSCEKARNVVIGKVESAFYSAKQAVLFSATPEAIKAVEKFEQTVF